MDGLNGCWTNFVASSKRKVADGREEEEEEEDGSASGDDDRGRQEMFRRASFDICGDQLGPLFSITVIIG